MFVYAIVEGDVYLDANAPLPFEKCCGVAATTLTLNETLVDEDPEAGMMLDEDGLQIFPLQRRYFPDAHKQLKNMVARVVAQQSVPLLAAICLGSSGGSFYDTEAGRMWTCKAEDLTSDGHQLLASLEKLYGRPAKLLTFLDT